jgi:bacillithiol biosynthesis cysteine-adding enzyme BshC
MSSGSDITTSGIIRDAIELRRFPWIRPLVHAYVNDFRSVATLFAGNPTNPKDWEETITRVQKSARDRESIAATVERQLQRRGAPAEARSAAARLRNPNTVAVVTGQQAGVFGGPLYTLLKAVTAIQLAARLEADHGVPVVPLFWVDEEDHDWDEIRAAYVLDADLSVCEIAFPDVPGARSRTVSSLLLDTSCEDAMAQLERSLPPSEFTGELFEQLRRHYRPGSGVGAAFAGWIDSLLGRSGLVVFESADRGTKALVADLFAAELAHPGRTSTMAREAAAAMRRLGHEPQVEPAEDSTALFYMDESSRQAIKHRGGEYLIGDRRFSVQALTDEARSRPEHFSPNVLLRPLVQDRLFPTVSYISGPSELAYQAQLKDIYGAFGVEVPLLYPRASATFLDAAAARFLDRHHVPLEAFQAQDDTVLNRLLEQQLPATLERALDEMPTEIARRAQMLKSDIAKVDPTLTGAVDTTLERMNESLKTLHHKIIQAAKRKDDTLRRQFQRTRNLTFPAGLQQERLLNVVFAVNRYGFSICERLIEALPLETGKHYVLVL